MMNITNHIKELKYRILYIILSFIACIGVCIEKKDILIFINFWSFFKETPIYYSGIFEYYLTVLELSVNISLIFLLFNLIINIYSYFRPIFIKSDLIKIKKKIIIYFIISILFSILIYFLLFPIFYKDFSIISKNIEFLPNITLIIKLHNSILLFINFLLIFLIFNFYFYFNINTKKERKFCHFFLLFISAFITPPGLWNTLYLYFILSLFFEFYFFFKFFHSYFRL